ncbi:MULTISPECIES: hypothetical protein [unclassified Bradyrhizobium]|uniref:hypothetical protein n=1 Tax=unclassified Bradyrhizobium TaxID=2631580 RepID=UPI002479726F|nr:MULTISPECIES: hypothetical protein [unclassified Bradyrhizobium]WGS17871.1 hypothetical protein MTX22_25035 [Bradyrhizobium sp. ISRA463]WGS24671.1 hypothetical protein MTX19_22700 [Bradyrhizobium sp. ISRA464]
MVRLDLGWPELAQIAHDGSEREFKPSVWLEGGVLPNLCIGDQETYYHSQREEAWLLSLQAWILREGEAS